MRSAYGFQIPSEDGELTRVGPGTPCGEFMRRYWQPVCASEDLKDFRTQGDLVQYPQGKVGGALSGGIVAVQALCDPGERLL